MSTKENLFEIALDLFSKDGFNATSIRSITKKAGVSVAAFYNHFKSKDELLKEMYDYYTSQNISNENLLEQYDSLLDKAGPLGLFEVIREAFSVSLKNEKLVKLSRIVSMEQYINETAREIAMKDKKIMLDTTQSLFVMMKDKNLIYTDNPELIGKLIGYAYLGFASENDNFSIVDGENPIDKLNSQSEIITEYIKSILIKN